MLEPVSTSSIAQWFNRAPWPVLLLGGFHLLAGLAIAWRFCPEALLYWNQLGSFVAGQHGPVTSSQLFWSLYFATASILVVVSCVGALAGHTLGRRWLTVAIVALLLGIPASDAHLMIEQFLAQGASDVWNAVLAAARHALSPGVAFALFAVLAIHLLAFYADPKAHAYFGSRRKEGTGSA